MSDLHALCVARHRFIAEHLARFFADIGVDTTPAVGVNGALTSARRVRPDLVICEYDLLVTAPLDAWEHDEVLRRTPVVAVSLTRRPNEIHPLDVNAIAGFLYLPALDRADAQKVLYAAAVRPTYVPASFRLTRVSEAPAEHS